MIIIKMRIKFVYNTQFLRYFPQIYSFVHASSIGTCFLFLCVVYVCVDDGDDNDKDIFLNQKFSYFDFASGFLRL